MANKEKQAKVDGDAVVNRDAGYTNSGKKTQPDGETRDGHHTSKEVQGPTDGTTAKGEPLEDLGLLGNPDTMFKGPKKALSGARKADQHAATGTAGNMNENPFHSVLRAKYFSESDNPGDGNAPATSDSPSYGMQAVNNTDFRPSRPDVKSILEGIALQAAEAFEALDENSNIPNQLISELQNCSKSVTKLYEFATKNQTDDGTQDASDTPPVQKDTAERKPEGVYKEEVEDLAELSAGQKKIAAAGKAIDPNNDEDEIDADDLLALRMRRKNSKKDMSEALHLAFNKILWSKLNGDS
jgi:hypothetical protein